MYCHQHRLPFYFGVTGGAGDKTGGNDTRESASSSTLLGVLNSSLLFVCGWLPAVKEIAPLPIGEGIERLNSVSSGKEVILRILQLRRSKVPVQSVEGNVSGSLGGREY